MHRARRSPSAALPGRLARLAASIVAALALAGGGPRVHAEESGADLEPIPSPRAFLNDPEQAADPDLARALEEILERTFASLGDVQAGRRLFVERFGVMSASTLTATLNKANNVTQVWNACLTVGALRDREGPAGELNPCLRPLLKVLTTQSDEFHSRAFAALALGCFHWPQAEPPAVPATYEAVPGPARMRAEAARTLAEARLAIAARLADKRSFLRVAAALALAKMGGTEARKGLLGAADGAAEEAGARQALLLARAFLQDPDASALLRALQDEERRVRAGAALGIAVSLLLDEAPAWTADVEPLLKALTGPWVMLDKDEGPEAVFARGVCALRNQVSAAWEPLWQLAIQPTGEARVAEAAAQALLFCDQPWFDREVTQFSGDARIALKDPVLALVLLRAGRLGTEDAIDACEKWLRSRARRPVPTRTWDPRWYAAVGLLRALHEGRIRVRASRERVVDALRFAAGRGKILDRRAHFRDELEALLATHGDALVAAEDSSPYRLPLAALRRVEASIDCPYGLLSRDLVDACVHRVNAMVELAFGLDGIKEGTPDRPSVEKQPEKHLKRFLDVYPYFTRREFREGRGLRPPPALDGTSDKVIDR